MILRDFLKNCILLSVVASLGIACASLNNSNSSTVVEVDGTEVTSREFLHVYNKNNLNEVPQGREEITDYLDLFINFKLKVREAESLGLDKDSSFIEELSGYQKQLARPYLTETRLLDSLSLVTYERLKTEVHASHILIGLPEDHSPEDTLGAYERIISLRELISSGEKGFGQAAFEHSEDPSAKQNRGDLGYFSAMQMVYPFEDAAYRLPVDSISSPIRTDFGYHLIKVHDRRPSQGRIQVSHILVRSPEGIQANDSLLAAKRAQQIYVKANSGEDWDLLCRQFSEDLGTKMKGGALPWFKTGDISNIPTFEKAAFEIENPGDIHEPVKTAYGWHIIRLNDKQGLESYESLESKIRANLTSSSRADLNQKELVNRLKLENHFKQNESVMTAAFEFANETLNKGTWKSQPHWEVNQKELFKIGKSNFLVSDFYNYLEAKQPLKYHTDPKQMMLTAYEDYVKETLIDYEEVHLADKHYDYKMLTKEYRDGILLFQLMEDKVWNQAIRDTVGLKEFYLQHKDSYQWDTRVDATVFNVGDESALNEVEKFLDTGYFTYQKYDFSGSGEDFNKAQERILGTVAQLLQQGQQRQLVMEFDTSMVENIKTRQAIDAFLNASNVDATNSVIRHLPEGRQGFLLYATSSSLNDLAENMNQKDPLTIQVESGRYQRGENQVVDKVEWEKGIHNLEVDGRKVLVHIEEIIPKGLQELEEIKGQVISDYQTHLEAKWVAELRDKYQVIIHEKTLEKIYKQYNL